MLVAKAEPVVVAEPWGAARLAPCALLGAALSPMFHCAPPARSGDAANGGGGGRRLGAAGSKRRVSGSARDGGQPKRMRGGNTATGWTVEEDLALLAGVRRYGTQFPLVAAEMPPPPSGKQRTPDAVRNRLHRLQSDQELRKALDQRKASERVAVDALLAAQSPPPGAASCGSLGPQHGALTEARPTRCIRGSEHGRAKWSAEEDALIEQAHSLHGGQWRRIAAQLPGRSDSSVRNRWVRTPPEARRACVTQAHPCACHV